MPADSKARSSLARWLIPAATFVAGAVVGTALLRTAPEPDLPQISVPTFGASSSPVQSTEGAAQTDLALQRDINDKFVAQLRRYEERLRAIATDAEGEGATGAAGAMRDFARETEALVDRYDLIVKKN